MSTNDLPLITFALFAYNQEDFICAAVEGALAQTYSPLEIILSDDCSSDSTFNLMRQMVDSYKGPHIVKIIRNSSNIGVCAHVNNVVNNSRGKLIVVSAGDDISEKDRVRQLVDVWQETGASAVYSNAMMIDDKGRVVSQWKIIDTPLDRPLKIRSASDIAVPRFYGAGAAYDRRILERFGPLPIDIRNEDYNLAWRAFFTDGIGYSISNLLQYRKHDNNLSFWSKISRAKTIKERIGYRIQMLENEEKNLRHIYKYALDIFGDESQVASIIEQKMASLEKRKANPYLYECWALFKDLLAQIRAIRWLYNKLHVNGKFIFLRVF